MTHTIGMISLGCAKNQVNAEHMLWLLRQAGYEISPDPDGAELVIVNTCGFIESAKTEAIDNILAMAQLKAEGRIQRRRFCRKCRRSTACLAPAPTLTLPTRSGRC